MTLLRFDRFEQDVELYSWYTQLLDSKEPIFDNRKKCWLVSRHDQVTSVLGDSSKFSSRYGNFLGEPIERVGASLGTTDPPEHTERRDAVARGIARYDATVIDPTLREFATNLLDRLVNESQPDLVKHYCAPFSLAALLKTLGFCEHDWVKLMPAVMFSLVGTGEEQIKARSCVYGYIVQQITRARYLGDGLQGLLRWLDESRCSFYATNDLIAGFAFPVMITSFATACAALSNVVEMMFLHDELNHPQSDYFSLAVEEALRLESPVQAVTRRSTDVVHIGQTAIGPDSTILAMIGCANRDALVFTEPSSFLIDRRARGERAITQGVGPHKCVGAGLALRWIRIAVGVLSQRTAIMHLSMRKKKRAQFGRFMLRGWARLPVEVSP